MLTLLSLSIVATLGAVLLSSTGAATLSAWRRTRAARRRAEARADEVALLAAAAQRWCMTPAAWGGAPTDGFAGVSFDALGVAPRLRRPDQRRTANGLYQMVHVPACATLDRAAARTGQETGRDGLLVVGWDPVTGDDTAAVVLSPLVQVPLASVPWAWIAELSRPTPAEAASEADAAVAPRTPDRPATAADRPAAPARLRLVSWPSPPAAPETGGSEPRHPPGWRRAA